MGDKNNTNTKNKNDDLTNGKNDDLDNNNNDNNNVENITKLVYESLLQFGTSTLLSSTTSSSCSSSNQSTKRNNQKKKKKATTSTIPTTATSSSRASITNNDNSIQTWNRIAACRTCLLKWVKSSEDVVRYDYRDSEIFPMDDGFVAGNNNGCNNENGDNKDCGESCDKDNTNNTNKSSNNSNTTQNNTTTISGPNNKIAFSVDVKCPICKMRYSRRTISDLLDRNNGGVRRQQRQSSTSSSNKNVPPQWNESILRTIELCNYGKKLKHKMEYWNRIQLQRRRILIHGRSCTLIGDGSGKDEDKNYDDDDENDDDDACRIEGVIRKEKKG